MKESILEIINGIPQSEPILLLELEYKKLKSTGAKEVFLSEIRSIANNGTIKEKFACLTLFEFLNITQDIEDIVKKNVDNIDFKRDELIISPLLTLCAKVSERWAIDFINNVMKKFKPLNNEYVYLYDIAIRSIVDSSFWKEGVEEISFALNCYDNDYVVDFVAYFQWKKGERELQELLVSLDENLFKKISKLKTEIKNRFTSNYKAFKGL